MAVTKYILMNQDTPVLDFICRRNEFDEPEFYEGAWYVDYRPIGYRGLAAFLEHRKAPKFGSSWSSMAVMIWRDSCR